MWKREILKLWVVRKGMHKIIEAVSRIAPLWYVRTIKEARLRLDGVRTQDDQIEVNYRNHSPDAGVVARELARKGFTIVNSTGNRLNARRGKKFFAITAHPSANRLTIRKGLLGTDVSKIGPIEEVLVNRQIRRALR